MEQDQRDRDLAMDYLGARVRDDGKKMTFDYLEKGSAGEAEAIAALVRLLRDFRPLDHAIRQRLAALFDPGHTLESRRLVLENRASSAQPNHARALEIALFIAERTKLVNKLELAKDDAVVRFGVSRSTVNNAWRDHKGGPLCRIEGSIRHLKSPT